MEIAVLVQEVKIMIVQNREGEKEQINIIPWARIIYARIIHCVDNDMVEINCDSDLIIWKTFMVAERYFMKYPGIEFPYEITEQQIVKYKDYQIQKL